MLEEDGITSVELENGYYYFKLFKVLKERGITQNRFLRDVETSYTTMKRYAVGTVQKVDLEMLDRWTKYLNCDFTDLIEYKRK